jgi:hypothetical protein
MGRETDGVEWISFDPTDLSDKLLTSRDVDGAGFEVRLSRVASNGTGLDALEAIYWSVFPETDADAYDPDGIPFSGSDLLSTFDVALLDYDGSSLVNFTDAALRHRLQQSSETHNVEVNSTTMFVDPSGRSSSRLGWMLGFRYFRFTDDFSLDSDVVDTRFSGAVEEVSYNVGVENNLFGVQIGGTYEHFFTPGFVVYFVAKGGVFGNHIKHDSFIGGAAGPAVVNDPTSPSDGQAFDVASDRTNAAFLGEMDFGLRWQLWKRLAFRGGYRVLSASRVALSTDQFPTFFSDLSDVAAINADGSLLMHGGYAGAQFEW